MLTIVVQWVAALIGPISIPLLLGMLPWFRRCGSRAALASWAAGLLAYALTYYVLQATLAVTVSAPILVSLAVFVGLGLVAPERQESTDRIIDVIGREDDETPSTKQGTVVSA